MTFEQGISWTCDISCDTEASVFTLSWSLGFYALVPGTALYILALKDTQGAQEFYFISTRIPINGIQNLSSPQFALKCPSLLLFVKQKRILSYTHDYFQKNNCDTTCFLCLFVKCFTSCSRIYSSRENWRVKIAQCLFSLNCDNNNNKLW